MARQTVLPGWWWAADSTAQACRWFMFSGPPMWTWRQRVSNYNKNGGRCGTPGAHHEDAALPVVHGGPVAAPDLGLGPVLVQRGQQTQRHVEAGHRYLGGGVATIHTISSPDRGYHHNFEERRDHRPLHQPQQTEGAVHCPGGPWPLTAPHLRAN